MYTEVFYLELINLRNYLYPAQHIILYKWCSYYFLLYVFQPPLQLDWGRLIKLWSVGDEQTHGYMNVFLISSPSFSSSLTQRAAGNKWGRLSFLVTAMKYML